MESRWKKWLHGLEATVVTGISNAIALVLADNSFDIFKDHASLWKAILTMTLVSVAYYLKQSPLPYYDFEGGSVPFEPIIHPKGQPPV